MGQTGIDHFRSETALMQETSQSPDDQSQYSASRIAAFLEDNSDPQIIHLCYSSEESIRDHTTRMATYLTNLDVALAVSEG